MKHFTVVALSLLLNLSVHAADKEFKIRMENTKGTNIGTVVLGAGFLSKGSISYAKKRGFKFVDELGTLETVFTSAGMLLLVYNVVKDKVQEVVETNETDLYRKLKFFVKSSKRSQTIPENDLLHRTLKDLICTGCVTEMDKLNALGRLIDAIEVIAISKLPEKALIKLIDKEVSFINDYVSSDEFFNSVEKQTGTSVGVDNLHLASKFFKFEFAKQYNDKFVRK